MNVKAAELNNYEESFGKDEDEEEEYDDEEEEDEQDFYVQSQLGKYPQNAIISNNPSKLSGQQNQPKQQDVFEKPYQ